MDPQKTVGKDVVFALAVAIALILLGLYLESTWVGFGLCVVIIPALIYAAANSPLRHSLMVLMFLALVLPNPQEGMPTFKWLPPFSPLGQLFLNHLNTFDHEVSLLSFCSFSGMDLCFLTLAIIHWYRKASRSKVDRAGGFRTPEPMLKLAWLSLSSTALVELYGLATGGDFGVSLWQVSAVVYIPLVFLLFQAAIRGPADHRGFAKVLLAAATYKSLLAIYVTHVIKGEIDPTTKLFTLFPYATAHADSILFADACLLLIALLLEREKIKLLAAVVLPTLMFGMLANKRRLVWVQVIAVLLTVYVLSKDNPVKRFVRRYIRIAAPIVAVYVAVGWNDGGGGLTFRPVRILKSVVDAKSDASSFWRELENFNLIMTLKNNMFLGTGYGHPYPEYVTIPAVDYPLEHYLPHNGILGLWAFSGYVGFAGLGLLWAGGVYFAMRSYHAAKNGTDRAAALVSFGAVLVWLMMCWGDLGLGVWCAVFTVAPALAVAGKLAVATGEWDDKRKNARARAVGAVSPPV